MVDGVRRLGDECASSTQRRATSRLARRCGRRAEGTDRAGDPRARHRRPGSRAACSRSEAARASSPSGLQRRARRRGHVRRPLAADGRAGAGARHRSARIGDVQELPFRRRRRSTPSSRHGCSTTCRISIAGSPRSRASSAGRRARRRHELGPITLRELRELLAYHARRVRAVVQSRERRGAAAPAFHPGRADSTRRS